MHLRSWSFVWCGQEDELVALAAIYNQVTLRSLTLSPVT